MIHSSLEMTQGGMLLIFKYQQLLYLFSSVEVRTCPRCKSKRSSTELHATMYYTYDIIVHQRKLDNKFIAEIAPPWQHLSKKHKFIYLAL